MPLYVYQCTKCAHRFEKIQNFSAEPIKECPECGGEVIRPLTAPALQFKGSGWYVNDYSSSSAPSSAAAPACPSASACPAAGGCAAAGSGDA